MWRKVIALVAAEPLILSGTARADDWPTHPLTMINPFAAGKFCRERNREMGSAYQGQRRGDRLR